MAVGATDCERRLAVSNDDSIDIGYLHPCEMRSLLLLLVKLRMENVPNIHNSSIYGPSPAKY